MNCLRKDMQSYNYINAWFELKMFADEYGSAQQGQYIYDKLRLLCVVLSNGLYTGNLSVSNVVLHIILASVTFMLYDRDIAFGGLTPHHHKTEQRGYHLLLSSYLDLDKKVIILQVTFSNSFLYESCYIKIKIQLKCVPRGTVNKNNCPPRCLGTPLIKLMAWRWIRNKPIFHFKLFNSLWPSDAIWRHRSGST